MKRYVDAVHAEWLKVFTTRSWWVLAAVMAAYVAFTAALLGLILGPLSSEMGQSPLGSAMGPGITRSVYAIGPTTAYLFPVLIGALSVTAEYRHHTLGSTFIWNGSRTAVLGAKVSVQFVMGVIYGILSLLAAVLASVFFLMAAGMGSGLGDGETWLMFLRASIAMGIWAVIGVGVGILVRNQAAAIVIVLVFTQFIEPVARMAGAFLSWSADIARFLPGAASDAFTGSSFYTLMTDGMGNSSLPWWAGGLVLAGYALVLVTLGWLTRWRGDVG